MKDRNSLNEIIGIKIAISLVYICLYTQYLMCFPHLFFFLFFLMEAKINFSLRLGWYTAYTDTRLFFNPNSCWHWLPLIVDFHCPEHIICHFQSCSSNQIMVSIVLVCTSDNYITLIKSNSRNWEAESGRCLMGRFLHWEAKNEVPVISTDFLHILTIPQNFLLSSEW